MNIPTIVKSSAADLEPVKAVLTLGFSSDALLRWVFPDASSYLKCFDIWMEEYSKIAFEIILFTQKKIYLVHLFGILLEWSLIIQFWNQHLNIFLQIE